MSIRKAQRADYEMAGTKPSHDHGELPRVLPLLLWDAHNPLIRRYFFRVFRFAKMGLAGVGT
jgi:hypothetical protein